MNWPGLIAQADQALLKQVGVATSYQRASGPAISVTGIFDAAYVRVGVGEAGVSSAGPAVFYRLSDLPVDPEPDDPTITIDGIAYAVVDVKKDGQGGVLLQLHKR